MFHNNLALVLLEPGRPHEAMDDVFKALECAPRLSAAYNALGNIQDHLGLKEEAIASYRRALDIQPRLRRRHVQPRQVLKDRT